ncbi:MAG TPA: DUF1598 domain-containing protein, partial [Planctomycetia bacterium]|nr:DUF1598 domain-containing protein [Planctomycetia bacterium]
MRDNLIRRFAAALVAASMLAAGTAYGQGGGGGVFVDGDGVLRTMTAAKGKAAAKLARIKRAPGEEEIGYVSLPKLAAAIKAKQEAGEKIPLEMANLGGIVQLQYVFVYPEEKDLVIAGPAEELDGSDPNRAVGRSTGRPALRFDDIAVALRTVGPGRRNQPFGCSIDMPPDGISNIQAESQRIGAVTGTNNEQIAARFRKAMGLQNVRLFGVDADTNAAFICLEADFLMKRLALGTLKPPHPQIKSHMSLMKPGESMYNRWWFIPNHEPTQAADDGLAFEFQSKGMKVKCSSSPTQDDADASASAKKFASNLSEHYAAAADKVPAFADLWNVTDAVIFAALVRKEDLHRKAGWDLGWVLDPAGYKATARTTPKQVEPLA